jgi:sensor domain CHASE-containing protein
MSIRLKTAVLVAVALAVALLAMHLVSQHLLIPSYARLEDQSVRTSLEQAVGSLDAELASLDRVDNDWAAWDDTYDFIQTGSDEYIESNMVAGTFTAIGLNVMVFLDTSGEVVYAKAMDLESEEEVALPNELAAHLSTGRPLLTHEDFESGTVGIMGLPEGILLVSSRPILTSDDEGPSRGSLVMGKFLTPGEVSRLAEVTRLSLSMTPVGLSEAPEGPPAGAATGYANDVSVEPIDRSTIEGHRLVRDIYGTPVLEITVRQSRELYAEGQRTIAYFLVVMTIGGVALFGIFLTFPDRTLLRRIANLGAQVRRISQSQDFEGQVSDNGSDEVGQLVRDVNDSFRSLEQAYRQLEVLNRDLEETTDGLRRREEELRASASQLQQLTAHLQSVREDERAAVAAEIHDNVGQTLIALKMDLSTVQRMAREGSLPRTVTLEGMFGLVDSAMDTVKRLHSDLRPGMLDDLGLGVTADWYLAEFERRRGLKTSLVVEGEMSLIGASRSLVLYRTLQEAATNAALHSKATEVRVRIAVSESSVVLAVEDNGREIAEDESKASTSFVLRLMQERARPFGGEVTMTENPRQGTTVVATLPLGSTEA